MSDDPPEMMPAEPPAAPGPLGAAARKDRRLFDSLNEGVWERDLNTGEVWYSARYKALLGFEDHELPNLTEVVRERMHPDDVAGVQQAFGRAALMQGTVECQARVRTKEGSYRWYRGRFTVWPDAQGRAAVLVGALYDVHEQIVATEALRAHQAVLEQRVRERTQKLAAALQLAEARQAEAERANRTKANFLAQMSHELRTPLNGVLGMTQLAHSLTVSAEQGRYLELAQQAGQTLLGCLDDVLDFACAEAGQLQLRVDSVDLATLAADTLRSFVPSVQRKGLQIGFDYIGDITRVRADAGRMRQIIGNLVGNAIKYTEAGRILLIIAADRGADGAPCRVRLRVRDTGVGMDEATRERVIEPFEQGDSGIARRHGGTGLGLSAVQVLARLMGGAMAVHSRPGRGSEVRVELQLPAEPEQPLRALAASTPRTGTVWVLVRDVLEGRSIGRRLERLGWSVLRMPDIATAIERLGVLPTGAAPDAVLMGEDTLRPGHDADFALLRRGLGPQVPMTLMLRPDFDLNAVHAASERWQMRIALAPLAPADLYALLLAAPEPGPAAPVAPAPCSPPRAAPQHVLVVEDNALNQIIAREMVAALGLCPAVVGSGEEAMLTCQSTPPDLVLMDIQMPGMDGLETTRRLRALQNSGHLRRFPIIALTAHAMASDRDASLAAGMDEHLTKPMQLDQLRRVLRHWLATGAG